jgi:hypothetical protein
MDGPGFHVDIATLDEASAGITETIDNQKRLELSKLPGPEQMYGDDDLHDAFKDYCHRWDDGFDILTDDANKISDSLQRVAQAYRSVDQAAAQRLTSDPATGAVDG